MQAVRLTEKRFTPPADLDPGDYLSGAFGVAVYDDIKPCTIRIRAYGDGPKYLRTLPLHDSQQEIETTADYAISNIGSLLLTSFTGPYWHSTSISRYCRRSPCEMKQSGSSTR